MDTLCTYDVASRQGRVRTVPTSKRTSEPPPRRVTMTAVAKAAGVSQTTVSFVLNNKAHVSIAEETRKRVLQAAADLNFRPNRAAQLLRSNRSKTIGIVTDGIVSRPYAGQIIQGIQGAVQPSDYVCMVIDVKEDPAQGERALANLLGEGVAGIIYASAYPKTLHTSSMLADTRTIVVYSWPEATNEAELVVLADDYGGGFSAAHAAFAAGHERVAFIGGRKDTWTAAERHRGFRDAAQSVGRDPDTLPQLFGDYQIGGGYSLTTDLMTDVPATQRPTALICGNDRMAVGSILALAQLGLSCPEDVSVIGFDDQPDVADQLGLTTVALPFYEMGRRAGEALLGSAQPRGSRDVIACPLIHRSSLQHRGAKPEEI